MKTLTLSSSGARTAILSIIRVPPSVGRVLDLGTISYGLFLSLRDSSIGTDHMQRNPSVSSFSIANYAKSDALGETKWLCVSNCVAINITVC